MNLRLIPELWNSVEIYCKESFHSVLLTEML